MAYRVYGHGGTVHRTEQLAVELGPDGKVVAVWFRCQLLPFREARADDRRAVEMRSMYASGADRIKLLAVTLDVPDEEDHVGAHER